MKRFLTLLCALTTFVASAADYDVVYKNTPQGELRMTILTPDGVKEDDKLPAVLFYHGGAFATGSRDVFIKQAEYLRTRGIVTISTEYRIRSRHKTSPIESLKDAKSAIRFVRANASKYNIDPDKIISAGGSAGGCLAAGIAMCDNINDEADDLSISTDVCAMLLFNPVICNGPDKKGPYQGWGYGGVKSCYKDFSPMHNIDKDVPPTLFMVGANDALIPPLVAQKYTHLLRELGIRCDLIIYNGCSHAFFNISNNDAKYFAQTIADAEDFLISLGYIKGRRTVSVEEWLQGFDDNHYTFRGVRF